ncbi:hypothetical protein MRX96_002156 [Rhipicephalus microplus]
MRLPLFAQVFALAIMAGPLVVTTVPTSARNLPWPDLGFPAMTPMPETFNAATLGSQLNTGTKSYPPRLVTAISAGNIVLPGVRVIRPSYKSLCHSGISWGTPPQRSRS